MKYTFHYVALAHLPVTRSYSSCAFTQKIHKLARMLADSGHQVILYGAGHTDLRHLNIEFVPVVSMDDVRQAWGEGDPRFELGYDHHASHGFREDFNAKIKTPCTLKFRANAIAEINRRKRPDHFLLLSMGSYHKPIANGVRLFLTCEPGIGYRGSWAPFRAFESSFIQYFSYGSARPFADMDGRAYDRVIPNYFDLDDFLFQPTPQSDSLCFIGRLIRRKGLHIAAQVAQHLGLPLRVAGQGRLSDVGLAGRPDIEHVGTLGVEERKLFLANARVSFTPTIYLEPFGGTAVESMLSGTPAISTNFGAFVETIQQGVSGYRCDTLADFVRNTRAALLLDRSAVQKWALQYSMDNVNPLFEKWWADLYQLYLSKTFPGIKGWNAVPAQEGAVQGSPATADTPAEPDPLPPAPCLTPPPGTSLHFAGPDRQDSPSSHHDLLVRP